MAPSRYGPTEPHERLPSLDALRGLALFGVLMVNLQTDFRVSLFTYYARFNANRGWANIATDYAIRFFLESKAFAIFSFLFGVGMPCTSSEPAAMGAGIRFALSCDDCWYWRGSVWSTFSSGTATFSSPTRSRARWSVRRCSRARGWSSSWLSPAVQPVSRPSRYRGFRMQP